MHTEWLNTLKPKQLSIHPQWVMERYLLSSGRPDRTKTTTVVGIPLPQHSTHRASEICEAASKVKGLHQATGQGNKTKTIFMGWNEVAVNKAAKNHDAKEAKETQAEENEREHELAEIHKDYKNTVKKNKGSRTYSPVGSYTIECKHIKEQWED